MNLVDENFPDDQRLLLDRKRVRVYKIGRDIGRKGMDDEDIIPLLHELDRPTLFTLDVDFFARRLCHKEYCLVYLDVDGDLAAECVRRVLRHPALNSKAKRMGKVIKVQETGLVFFRVHDREASHLEWD